jgi:hypothetical protein
MLSHPDQPCLGIAQLHAKAQVALHIYVCSLQVCREQKELPGFSLPVGLRCVMAGLEQGDGENPAEERVGERQQVPVQGRQLGTQRGGRPGEGGGFDHVQAETLR